MGALRERRASALAPWLARPRSVLLWALALSVAGAWQAAHLPVEWVPSAELPTIVVTAAWPGASPRAVEKQVTAPVERALRGIPGTSAVESRSLEGQAWLRLEVAAGKDLGLYTAEVADRLAALRASLPPYVVPRLTPEVPEAFRDEQDFMTLQLVGALRPDVLRRVAEEIVAPRLRSLAGVAGVTAEGGEERELLVSFDAARLAIHGLTIDTLRRSIQDTLSPESYGWLARPGSRHLVHKAVAGSAAEIARLPLAEDPESRAPVRVADVAEVRLGSAPVQSISRVAGKPVVTLRLDRAPGSHLLETAAGVTRALSEVRPDLPEGVELLVADDQSEDVREELGNLALSGGLGLAAVVLVLWLLLRGPRAVALVLGTVVLSFAVALLLMKPFGLTLNLLTLAGLALLLGLLVDNGTVLVVQLAAERRRGGPGLPYAEAARRALEATWLPLLGCTATTIAVFLPMVYLSGELRSIFAPFAVLSSVTLGLSLLSSTALVLVLGRYAEVEPSRSRKRGAWRRRSVRALLGFYRLVVAWPKLSLLFLALAIGLPTPLLPDRLEEPEEGWADAKQEERALLYNRTLGTDTVRSLRRLLDPAVGGVTRAFLDEVELGEDLSGAQRPEVVVWLRLPPGSGIETADRLLRPFEEAALASPAVRRVLARIGADRAQLRVLFFDQALEEGEEPYAVRERLIDTALQISGIEVGVAGLVQTSFFTGRGDVANLTAVAYGPGYDGLGRLAAQFAERLRRDPRVADVDLEAGRRGQPAGREVVRLGWGAAAVAQSSRSASEVAGLLQHRLETWAPSFYAALEGEPRVPVRLVTAGAQGEELSRLLAQPLGQVDGGALRLDGLASLSLERDPPAIEREDQQYRRTIEIFYRGPAHMGRALIDKEIRALPLPPGYRLERPRAVFFSDDRQGELLWLIAATLAIIVLVTAAVLESWKLAFWVLLSIPTAWIGTALGFLVTDESFAEGAFLGAVLTLGLVVNVGILLADRYQRLRRARPQTPPPRLVLLALRNRLRPLWATTLTAVVGMVPVLLLSDTEPFWRGLAITVIGGLLSSALLAPAAMAGFLAWRGAGSGEA